MKHKHYARSVGRKAYSIWVKLVDKELKGSSEMNIEKLSKITSEAYKQAMSMRIQGKKAFEKDCFMDLDSCKSTLTNAKLYDEFFKLADECFRSSISASANIRYLK